MSPNIRIALGTAGACEGPTETWCWCALLQRGQRMSRACVHVLACAHACVRAHFCACIRACLRVCVRVYAHLNMYTKFTKHSGQYARIYVQLIACKCAGTKGCSFTLQRMIGYIQQLLRVVYVCMLFCLLVHLCSCVTNHPRASTC